MANDPPISRYANIAGAGTTVISTKPGMLKRVVFNAQAVSTGITIYDNTAASGTKIASPSLGVTLITFGVMEYDCFFTIGLTVVGAAGWDATVVYQ